jgi:hypothetical protein
MFGFILAVAQFLRVLVIETSNERRGGTPRHIVDDWLYFLVVVNIFII